MSRFLFGVCERHERPIPRGEKLSGDRIKISYLGVPVEEVDANHFKKRPETSVDLKLSRGQRAKLSGGEQIRIAGDGECPVEPGFQVVLVKGLTLTVDKVRVPKGGGWSLQYTLTDTRELEQPHHLRSTPPVHREDGKPPSPSSIAQAREESSYTSRADMMDAGHAPPTEWLDRHAGERRSGDVERRLRARSDEMADALERAEESLQNLHRVARETGMDVRSDLRVVKRRIEAIKNRKAA